ncbi:hypothetical protein BGX29_000624 [Mortierella sp. GBA35]|nr:hypothetical protein BGX29_000624 [Mortierella sp. GBA35]
MTASALASPALSESSLCSSSSSSYKAQTSNKDTFEQSHPLDQSSSLFAVESNNNALSPASTSSSFSPSPSPSHTQIHNNSHPSHPMFTPTTSSTTSSQQQHHHQLQILGNHPASPVTCTFLDLPEDPFMPTRANLLFSESEYRQASQEPIYENGAFMPYGTAPAAAAAAPSPEDCQSSNEYIYSQAHSMGPASNSSYMMPMTRTFSDSQLSDISSFESNAAALAGQASLNHATGTAMCQSPMVYNSQVVYNDDYYASAHQHNLYSQQHSQSHHHHHHHSYSTSSLSSISEDSSSLSPRSPFSNHGSMSLSSSCNSLASYPLSRTLSESSVPFFQSMGGSPMDGGHNNSNNSNGMTGSNSTSLVRPTPKRSRGRRVSCNPDNSGCKVFTCRFEDCGKIFKRSEHLKRHVRSIHTMEKPFECPIMNCPKRFSRSDNLNQHIRIHRHNGRGDKGKSFSAFTPFLQNYPNELLSTLS